MASVNLRLPSTFEVLTGALNFKQGDFMIIEELDFAAMYREHLQRAERSHKSAEHWDKRAEKMAENCARPKDSYLEGFFKLMDLSDCDTLLDMGCGPGSVCLGLADKMQAVYGLDYSSGMLEVAKRRADAEGLSNVTLIKRAWEDDWSDIPVCDIAVASRSTLVGCLKSALEKLNRQARKRVYTTHTVSSTFIDPAIIQAIGRKVVTLPNYLYAVNILQQMGIKPKVDFIESSGCMNQAESYAQFEDNVAWSLGPLDEPEKLRLQEYYQRHKQQGKPLRTGDRSWAMVYWDATPLS